MASNQNKKEGMVKITASNGETISLLTTDTNIKFETFQQEVLSKSSSMGVTVIISGKFTDDNAPEAIKIFNWSKSFERESIYRNLEILTQPGQTMDRKYKFPEMFVLNYEEKLGKDEASTYFTLTLRQKEDHFDDIETY